MKMVVMWLMFILMIVYQMLPANVLTKKAYAVVKAAIKVVKQHLLALKLRQKRLPFLLDLQR